MKPKRHNKKHNAKPAETLQTAKKKLKRQPSSRAASSGSPKASGAAASPAVPEPARRVPDRMGPPGSLQGGRAKRAIAAEASSEAGDSFRTIADSMTELVSFIDAEQRYQFNNKSYERWFGITPEVFKGRPVREMLGEQVYAAVRPYIEKALAGVCTSFEGFVPYEKLGRRYVQVDYVPRRNDGGKVLGFYVVIRDLTELKEAEEKCHTFLEIAPDAMVVHNPEGKISMVNAQTERIFGYSRQEIIGQPVEILIPERFRDAHVDDKAAFLNNPVARYMGGHQEIYAKRKDGSEFPVEVKLSPIETANGVFVSSTIRDITERKQLAQQIRWSAILEERSRMARDIHDTLAQGFTAVILNLEVVEEACADLPEEVRRRITRAREVARESLEEARRSLLALSSLSPAGVDFISALRACVDRLRSNAKTGVELSILGTNAPLLLDATVQENLLRIAQQAMDNALEHARARTIRIELAVAGRYVQLQIRDDGQGFDLKKVGRGLGLTGMRERATSIGGKIKLDSRPGKGTCVEVKVAFPATTRAAASP
jgi:PAS domain S-box-containing protein